MGLPELKETKSWVKRLKSINNEVRNRMTKPLRDPVQLLDNHII